MKTPLGTGVDLGPGHVVLDGDPCSCPRKRGTAVPSPLFDRRLLWPRSPILATAELLYKYTMWQKCCRLLQESAEWIISKCFDFCIAASVADYLGLFFCIASQPLSLQWIPVNCRLPMFSLDRHDLLTPQSFTVHGRGC